MRVKKKMIKLFACKQILEMKKCMTRIFNLLKLKIAETVVTFLNKFD